MNYLFSISIGPVQGFIAAARRTSDLRAGSQMLQRLASHIAGHVEELGGTLVFPASAKVPGPNKVVAIVETEHPAQVADQLQVGAVEWLMAEWDNVRQKLQAEGILLNEPLARAQISRFLEFYAAWVPLQTDYAAARERVEHLLSARKRLRDFIPPPSQQGIPKSPLDPSCDCVVILNRQGVSYQVPEPGQRSFTLRLKSVEYLDALSLIKRAQRAEDVPSTSLMAARSILSIAEQLVPEAVGALRTVVREVQGQVDIGDLMFPSRLQEESASLPLLAQHRGHIEEAQRRILRSVKLSECLPYYAVLVADGDRMGQLISAQRTLESHRQLSAKLAAVAQQMAQAISKHEGYCVYVGGDDVLALLPANRALPCAQEIADLFRDAMRPFAAHASEGGTLSVGIAFVHHLEPLQRAVEWARQAEGLAKGKRNAVAVVFHPRGGAPVQCVTRWSEDPYLQGWSRWIEAFRAGVSHGLPYELLDLSREVEGCNLPADLIRQEALRIFKRKRLEIEQEHLKALQAEIESMVGQASAVRELANRLIIARFLSRYPEVAS